LKSNVNDRKCLVGPSMLSYMIPSRYTRLSLCV